MRGWIRVGLPKMHGQIRIGLPKVHGWFRIGPPHVFHSIRKSNPVREFRCTIAIMQEKQQNVQFEIKWLFGPVMMYYLSEQMKMIPSHIFPD